MQIHWLTQPCPAPDQIAQEAALAHQSRLTKPAGSLGRLESIATQFASWQGCVIPRLDTVAIRIFAADHGVCAQGISAFPQAVTRQMILNFISGGAAISVLARQLDADFSVINMGTVSHVGSQTGGIASNSSALNTDDSGCNGALIDVQIASQTNDFTQQPAMKLNWLNQALDAGRSQVPHCDLFIGGEMGIGNTTSASALYSAILSLPATETVGPGTGLDLTEQAHKADVIESALTKHRAELTSPLAVLQYFGGFEIAALVGAYIAAAQRRIPVLVDGFICTSAALIACKINPSSRDWMLFAHQSAEPAHQHALQHLNASPILNLHMRLGEGSGAAIAVPLLKSALDLHANMATFEHAGVSEQQS